MKKKNKGKQRQQRHNEDFLTNNVVSGAECTGLLQNISGRDEEAFLRELYHLPGDGIEDSSDTAGVKAQNSGKKPHSDSPR